MWYRSYRVWRPVVALRRLNREPLNLIRLDGPTASIPIPE